MIPIRDYPSSNRIPFVTISIIAINVIVFLYQSSLPSVNNFFAEFALVPGWVDFANPATLYPFVTSQFLHGDFMHILFNMWFLWVFADNVEEKLGRVKFLIFYLAGGTVAALLQYAFMSNAIVPMIGASGAISAVLGFYLVSFPNHKVQTLFYYSAVMISAKSFLAIWFIIQFSSGLGSLRLGGDAGGVAWWAHIGGFAFGFIVAKMVEPRIPTSGSRYMEIKM